MLAVWQFAFDDQVGDFEVVALLGQFFDRIAAVAQDPDVAVDKGDAAPARGGVRERRIVRHQSEVIGGSLASRGSGSARITPPSSIGISYCLPVRLSVTESVFFAIDLPRLAALKMEPATAARCPQSADAIRRSTYIQSTLLLRHFALRMQTDGSVTQTRSVKPLPPWGNSSPLNSARCGDSPPSLATRGDCMAR